MACTLPYIETKFRKSNPDLADKLNQKHLDLVESAIASKLFTKRSNKLYLSNEGTKKRVRQLEYIQQVNADEGFTVMQESPNGTLWVNVVPKTINNNQLEENITGRVIATKKLSEFDNLDTKRLLQFGDPVIEIVENLEYSGISQTGLHSNMTGRVYVDSKSSPEIVLHEALHALTARFITANPSSVQVKALQRLFDRAKQHAEETLDFPDMYGLENLNEFVAEAFSNRQFQGFLTNVPSNLWERFKNWLKRLYGVEKSFLDKVMDVSESIMAQPQEASAGVQQGNLEERLITFLNDKGISATKIKAFKTRMAKRGTPVTVYGFADMLKKTIGYSDISSLVEETAHMMVDMFVETNNSIFEQVTETEVYKQVKEEYKDVYQTEEEFKREALGKLVKQAMIDNNDATISGRLLRRIKYYWNKFIDFVKGAKGLETYLQEIIDADPTKFDSSKLEDKSTLFSAALTPEEKILKKAIESNNNRLQGMQSRLVLPKKVQGLTDQINSLKLDLLKGQAERGIEKLIGYIKFDLQEVEKYIQTKTLPSSAVLDDLKDFVYYYKGVLNDIQFINGHPEIDAIVGRMNRVEQYYIDNRKQALKSERGIDVGEEIETDINRAEYYFGSLRDTGSDIARRVHAMITHMKEKVWQTVYPIAKQLVADTQAVDFKRLREKVNGKFTHYFITEYKLGEYYAKREQAQQKLREKYKLEEGQFEPVDPKEALAYRKEWHKWRSENEEREMLPEFYEIFLNMSFDARQAREAYSLQIRNLLLEVTDSKGNIKFEDLTDEQWAELEKLQLERRRLANLYYKDGTKKEGTDLEIALEIKQVNEKLAEHQTRENPEYAKLWRKKKQQLSPTDFKKWESRTTDTIYTQEFYDELAEIESKDTTAEYEKLKEEKNELLKPYRKSNLEVNVDQLPEAIIVRIKELDEQMFVLQQANENKAPAGKKFSDVARVEKTQAYAKAYGEAKKKGEEHFKQWYEANHFKGYNGAMKPISIWTHIVPLKKSQIKTVPKSYWMETSEESVFYNPKFKKDWKGPQPNDKYKNSEYDNLTVEEKRVLNRLLEENFAAHDIYKSSSKRYYQLPQVMSTLLDQTTSGEFRNVTELVKRSITDQADDLQQGAVDSKGKMRQYTRPDGSQAYFIPKPYVTQIDDPELITSDLVSSVIAIRTQAEKFKESSKMKSTSELLLDTLKDSKHVSKSGKVTIGAETNLYQALRGFFEEHLFGISAPPIGHVNIFGLEVNMTKVLNKIEKYVRDKNLIGNMFTVATAYTTGKVFSAIEDLVGQYTNTKAKWFARKEYAMNSHQMLLEMGQKIKSNKVGLIVERFHGEIDIFKDLDKSRGVRLLSDSPYGPYSLVGHTTTSKITIAMLYDHRWDGKQFVQSRNYKGDNWDSLPTMYEMFEVKDGAAVVKKQYEKILTVDELAKMQSKIKFVTDRIDSRISSTDKAAAHRHAIGKLLTTHRGWLFRLTQDKFKRKGFNYVTEQYEEGNYRTWWRFVANTFMRPDRIRLLKNMLLEWEQLEDYEKRNVIRCLYEISAVVIVGIIARMLQAMSDDEDDEDSFIHSAAYIANRTLLETSVYPSLLTPLTLQIGGSELGSLLSSPIAGVKTIDTLTDIVYIFDGEEIESGKYEGMTRREKLLIKMTPGLHGYFTTISPKESNQFLKNKALKPLGWIYKED